MEKQIDKIMRCFLWGTNTSVKKKGWVGWKTIRLTKVRGGAGIKKLRLLNKALHAKWVWRYGKDKKALWRSIVNQKFGGNPNALLPNDSSKPIGKSLWASILKSKDIIQQNSTCHIQSGDRVSFWLDNWFGDFPLSSRFPSLYRLARNKHAVLNDMIVFTNNISAWDLNFSRNLKEDELGLVAELLQLIHNPMPLNMGEDYLSWNTGNSFTVKSCHNAIEFEGLLRFPYKNVWNHRVPQKVTFFHLDPMLHGCTDFR